MFLAVPLRSTKVPACLALGAGFPAPLSLLAPLSGPSSRLLLSLPSCFVFDRRYGSLVPAVEQSAARARGGRRTATPSGLGVAAPPQSCCSSSSSRPGAPGLSLSLLPPLPGAPGGGVVPLSSCFCCCEFGRPVSMDDAAVLPVHDKGAARSELAYPLSRYPEEC